jgi:WD40 repeat protein
MITKIRLVLITFAMLTIYAPMFVKAQSIQEVYEVAWNPSGDKLALGYSDGQIIIIDALSGTTLKTYQIYTESVALLAWQNDTTLVATGTGYGITFININTDVVTKIPLDKYDKPGIVPGLTDDQVISGTAGENILRGLVVWDKLTSARLVENTETGAIFSLARSHNKQLLAVGDVRGSVNLHSTQDLQLLTASAPLTSKGDTLFILTISSVAWSNNDQFIVSGHENGDIRMWEVSRQNDTYTLQLMWVANGSMGLDPKSDPTLIRDVAFNPDQKKVSAVNDGGDISVWDAQTGNLISITRTGERLRDADFSPDGARLAVASQLGGYSIMPVASAFVETATPTPALP